MSAKRVTNASCQENGRLDADLFRAIRLQRCAATASALRKESYPESTPREHRANYALLLGAPRASLSEAHHLKTSKSTADARRRELTRIDGKDRRQLACTEPSDETPRDEHADVDGARLKSAAEDDDETSGQEAIKAAEAVGDESASEGSDCRAGREGGDDACTRR